MSDWVEDEIARRTDTALTLVPMFADLKGLPYTEFIDRTLDRGYDFDFVTAGALYRALNQEAA